MNQNNKSPRSLLELEQLIRSRTQESVHLDYKRSQALQNAGGLKEISKDVSAFLNSDGGTIVFGIEEQHHVPVPLDQGVANSLFSREQLEHLILSNVAPRPDGSEVVQIE